MDLKFLSNYSLLLINVEPTINPHIILYFLAPHLLVLAMGCVLLLGHIICFGLKLVIIFVDRCYATVLQIRYVILHLVIYLVMKDGNVCS